MNFNSSDHSKSLFENLILYHHDNTTNLRENMFFKMINACKTPKKERKNLHITSAFLIRINKIVGKFPVTTLPANNLNKSLPTKQIEHPNARTQIATTFSLVIQNCKFMN